MKPILLAVYLTFAVPLLAQSGGGGPVFVSSKPNEGWSNGGYYVHNNMWNASSGQMPATFGQTPATFGQTLYARAFNDWYVIATFPDTTSVKSYPNVHKDINGLKGLPLASWHEITSTFAAKAPQAGIYDVAYDIWLNGVGSGRGVTELMIWTENRKQVPLGKVQGHVTFGGVAYDAWHFTGNGANVITLVPDKVMTSGKLDLKAIFDWAIQKGWIPANPTVNQIDYGVEICSTENKAATFYFTDFSVTMK